MQFDYTTIVSLIILIFNLWVAIEGENLDIEVIILAVCQGLLTIIYIFLFVKIRKKKGNAN